MGPHIRHGIDTPDANLRGYWYRDDHSRQSIVGHVGRKLRDKNNLWATASDFSFYSSSSFCRMRDHPLPWPHSQWRTKMTVHHLEGRTLTRDDLARIGEFADQLRSMSDLPEPVREGITELLRLVADGRAVSVIDNDAVLSPNQAARLVGVSRPLLNQILDEGRIPFFETTGGHRKIKFSDVNSYIEERDLITSQLAAARAARTSDGEAIATDLGLDADTAKRLGFT